MGDMSITYAARSRLDILRSARTTSCLDSVPIGLLNKRQVGAARAGGAQPGLSAFVGQLPWDTLARRDSE